MSATVRARRECYASEHELFDIGLASVEMHANGPGAATGAGAALRGGIARVGSLVDGGASPSGDGHHALILCSMFVRIVVIGVALFVAGGITVLQSDGHRALALLALASGAVLARYGWHGIRTSLAFADRTSPRSDR
jgi:hypothetical protein